MKYTYRSRNIGHDLCSAVGKSNLVSSGGVITITLFMSVEVGEGVVILDGVGVLVHWGEVGVGGFSGVWCGGSISWRASGGGASCCEKSGREESLRVKNLSL